MNKLLMLDLCCGLGGASSAMRDRGWDVITVDVEPCFNPTHCIDAREFRYEGDRPRLVWASPPCTEFARESMPWCRTGETPDLSIMLACWRLIQDINPQYWVIENVRGAINYFTPILGETCWQSSPYFLWGNLPPLGRVKYSKKKKESFGSKQWAERSRIPYEISLAVAIACEGQLILDLSA